MKFLEEMIRICLLDLVIALLGKKYGHKRDVWALGAMYFQLITGKYVFGSERCSIKELED